MASASCRTKHTPASTWVDGTRRVRIAKGAKGVRRSNTPTDPGQIDGNFGQEQKQPCVPIKLGRA